MNRFIPLLLCACSSIGARDVTAQESRPFRARNLSPLASIFGLPAWHAAHDSFEISVTSELANHFSFGAGDRDVIMVDGETWRNSLFIAKTFGDAWSVSFELPHYRVSGGTLDDLVDAWHSTFGLPDGGRNQRPESALLFSLERDGQPFYQLMDERSGLGDAQIGVGYRLGRDSGVYANAWLKLPTGDEQMLAGSGSTDWAVTFLQPRDVMFRGRRAGYYWGVGAARLGQADLIAYVQEGSAVMAVVGGSLSLAERIGVKLQLDFNSALYRSELREIGDAALPLTIGGWWQFAARGSLEFGINEDLSVGASPDVVLHAAARWQW
jgi:hypothetical protein